MNKETLAAMLHGREYGAEITIKECLDAKEDRLVVVFGASDDIVQFAGFINDEFGARDGKAIPIDENGLVLNQCCDDECPYYNEKFIAASKVIVRWKNEEPPWSYETKIPHATFDIMEDNEVFCRGIVFSMDDVMQHGDQKYLLARVWNDPVTKHDREFFTYANTKEEAIDACDKWDLYIRQVICLPVGDINDEVKRFFSREKD